MVTWGGKMAIGSGDKMIRVWDAGAGTHEQTLAGHEGAVVALAVSREQRLISSSMDKTVKVWSMATWACMHSVQAYAAGSAQFIFSLAVSGPTLVGGSFSNPHSLTEEYEARVWDLETLEPLHTLRQAAGYLVLWAGKRWGGGVGGGRGGCGGVGTAGLMALEGRWSDPLQ